MRESLAAYLNNSPAGIVCDLLNAGLSIWSCVVYVMNTYIPGTPFWMFLNELSTSNFFLFAYFLNFVLARNKLVFIFSLQAIVDAVTLGPVYYGYFMADFSGSSAAFLRFTRMIKITRVIRLLRLLRSVNVLTSPIEDAVKNQVMSTALLLFIMVIGTYKYIYI